MTAAPINDLANPNEAASVLPPLPSPMAPSSAQVGRGGGPFAVPTTVGATPSARSSVLPPLASDHPRGDLHGSTVAGEPSAAAQGLPVIHESSGGGTFAATPISLAQPIEDPASLPVPAVGHNQNATREGPASGTFAAPTSPGAASTADSSVLPPSAAAHAIREIHPGAGGGNSSNQPPNAQASPNRHSGGWLELRIWAEMFHDAQKTRIAAHNRAERGGVSPDIYTAYTEATENAEHVCKLALARTYRRVVPGEIIHWQKAERGIGEPLLARLLGHLGDPYIATPYRWMAEPPEAHECGGTCGADRHLVALEPFSRTVGQLWAYCGIGDPARKRRRLMDVDEALAAGKPLLKSLVYLLAVACVKQPAGSRYRDAYDAARMRYADRVHVEACPPCHAKPEQPWKPGHQHAAALRLVGKEILRDLWLAAREAHSTA